MCHFQRKTLPRREVRETNEKSIRKLSISWRYQGLSRIHNPRNERTAERSFTGPSRFCSHPRISLRGQRGGVSEQELNLFKFFAVHMAQLCTSSAEIVRSDMFELHPLGTSSNHVPNHVLRDPSTQWGPMPADRPEHSAFCHFCWYHPAVDRSFDPNWHPHCSNAAALTNQVNDSPMLLSDL
jgi:hypothetical protein